MKKAGEDPGPGEYPREFPPRVGAEPWTGGPSVRKGGAMSLAYVADPDHLLELNNICRDADQPHHTTPGPCGYDPKKLMKGFDAITYR